MCETAEITPFGLNAEQVRLNFSLHYNKNAVLHISQQSPLLQLLYSADVWQRDNLNLAYLFDYIMEPSAENSKQETFSSPQTVVFFLAATGLSVCAASS